MVHFTALPKDEDASSDDTPHTPGVSPPDQLLYRPHGRWEWTAGLPIDDPKPLLSLRSEFSPLTESSAYGSDYPTAGLMCSASIDTGFIAGKQIKYICRK